MLYKANKDHQSSPCSIQATTPRAYLRHVYSEQVSKMRLITLHLK